MHDMIPRKPKTIEPSRDKPTSDYHGFNGQEEDNEIYGEGSTYNFSFRKLGETYIRTDYKELPLKFHYSKRLFSTEKTDNVANDKQQQIDKSKFGRNGISKNKRKMKSLIITFLMHIFILNVMYSQSNGNNSETFKNKSLYYINDSIKGLVMDSQYFIDEMENKFKLKNIDSVWVPTRSDINHFEHHLVSKLQEKSAANLVVENYNSYFRQYFGMYCGDKKMIFAIFKYEDMDKIDETLYVHKSFIQNLMGGGTQYFHVLFEFPDKLYEIHFNPYR